MNKLFNTAVRCLMIPSALIGSIALSAQAETLIYTNKYFEYALPESIASTCYEKDNCPKISIQYANSSQPWMNAVINSNINQMIPALGSSEDSDTEDAARNEKTHNLLSVKQVTDRLNRFAYSQSVDIPEDSSLSYSFEVSPSYLGHAGDVELFEVGSNLYLGGAHGMPHAQYIMLDSASRKQLTLDDLLVDGGKEKYKALAYTAFKGWVESNNEDVKDYERMWKYKLDDNVLLTHEGLVTKYQPYAIAAYAYGMPELLIKYDDLKGVLKDKYLKQ